MLHLKYVVRFKPLINWTCLHNANQCQYLRHLEEIDCSVAIVGRPAAIYKILGFMGGGGKSMHWPYIQCQSLFYSGLGQNYCFKQGQQAGSMSSLRTSLDAYSQYQFVWIVQSLWTPWIGHQHDLQSYLSLKKMLLTLKMALKAMDDSPLWFINVTLVYSYYTPICTLIHECDVRLNRTFLKHKIWYLNSLFKYTSIEAEITELFY